MASAYRKAWPVLTLTRFAHAVSWEKGLKGRSNAGSAKSSPEGEGKFLVKHFLKGQRRLSSSSPQSSVRDQSRSSFRSKKGGEVDR